jgi:hypothetical protein
MMKKKSKSTGWLHPDHEMPSGQHLDASDPRVNPTELQEPLYPQYRLSWNSDGTVDIYTQRGEGQSWVLLAEHAAPGSMMTGANQPVPPPTVPTVAETQPVPFWAAQGEVRSWCGYIYPTWDSQVAVEYNIRYTGSLRAVIRTLVARLVEDLTAHTYAGWKD